MHKSNQDLKISALILTPILLFLLVWVGACLIALADDSMISMDKGIIVILLIMGFFTIKNLSLSLMSIIKMYKSNKNSSGFSSN
jgi:hypothetical protein